MLAEMRQLSTREPSLRPEELLEMVTINPATALGEHHRLGRIAPGYAADLIAIPASGVGDHLLQGIVEFDGTMPWVMVAGENSTC